MPIKMIVTDLDRTLLRSGSTISAYTAEVLKRCRAKGIKVVFATARPLYGISAFLEQAAVDAAITQNGAGIYANGVLIAEHTIPEDIAGALYERLRAAANGFACSAQTLDQRFMNRTRASIVTATDTEIAAAISGGAISLSVSIFEDDALPKVAFHTIALRRFPPEAFKQIAEEFPALRYYATTGEDLIDVHAKEASKWNAVQTVAEHFGISIANIAAFGDDHNDIEMLQNCGVGIAVANAIDEAKTAADDICDSNDNDGMAKWLARVVLHEGGMP